MKLRLVWGLRFSAALFYAIAYIGVRVCFSTLYAPEAAHADVYLAQDEALKLAFPQADVIDRITVVVDDSQAALIEKQAQSKLESHLITFFAGRMTGTTIGYAAIESHVVRTHHQTFMVVLSPQGIVQKTVMLAFHEPPEYIASPHWLSQLEGIGAPEQAKIGGAIAGIVGSTLTSQGVAAGIRRVLASFEVLQIESR